MNVSVLGKIGRVWLACCALLAASVGHAANKEGAINVAVYGFEYAQNSGSAVNTLVANGYNANKVSLAEIAAGLPGYDVLYVTHPYDAGGWSIAACNGMKNFLAAGKGVALEWDASVLAFTTVGPNIYVIAAPQCTLFSGVADRGRSVGYNTPITITDPSSPLVAGLANPFAMGAASDYMYQIVGYDLAVWRVSAVYAGWASPNNAALMYARYRDAGCIALGTMAYGDNGYSSQLDNASRTLFLNMIATVSPGARSCNGAVTSASWPVPATSPGGLAALLAMMGASAWLMRRRLARRA